MLLVFVVKIDSFQTLVSSGIAKPMEIKISIYICSDIFAIDCLFPKILVKFKPFSSTVVFTSGHMVTAGNGIFHMGVDFSDRLTITDKHFY